MLNVGRGSGWCKTVYHGRYDPIIRITRVRIIENESRGPGSCEFKSVCADVATIGSDIDRAANAAKKPVKTGPYAHRSLHVVSPIDIRVIVVKLLHANYGIRRPKSISDPLNPAPEISYPLAAELRPELLRCRAHHDDNGTQTDPHG